MERKIGEISKRNDEWYQCIRSILTCSSCEIPRPCTKIRELGYCSPNMRNDKEQIVFKKLKKVGEPFIINWRKYQAYITHVHPYILNEPNSISVDDSTILVRIKQNKEDMEENKLRQGVSTDIVNKINQGVELMNGCFTDYTSNDKKIDLKLKPFDLEAAKAGKPVCTRDGRKARIICFDRRDTDNRCIVALIEDKELPNKESIRSYYDNGKYLSGDEESVHDLMMLPEKKEGWILLRKDGCVFDNEEVAKKNCTDDYFVAKVEWEE